MKQYLVFTFDCRWGQYERHENRTTAKHISETQKKQEINYWRQVYSFDL